MTEAPPATLLAILRDPACLQVFAAMITATGPGHQRSWTDSPNTISTAYLTATGAANSTGLSVAASSAAFQALERGGLAIRSGEGTQSSAWRFNADAFSQPPQAG